MPWSAAHAQSPPVTVRDFALTHDLRDGLAADEASGARVNEPLPASVALLLESASPGLPAWWRTVAEAWEKAGLRGLTRVSATRGWRLAQHGAVASWEDLQILARLLAQSTVEQVDRSTSRAPGGLEREEAEAKRSRLNFLFGRSSAGGRVAAMEERDDAERLLMCTLRPDLAVLARCWHRNGYDRLVIEYLFARIANQRLSAWLPDFQQALVWCGLAFYRVGDQATAQACFTLALAPEEDPPATMPAPDERKPDDALTMARDYLSRFTALDEDPGSPFGIGPFGMGVRSVGYARLAAWLEDRGLHGYLPVLMAQDLGRNGFLRTSAVTLPVRAIAGRHGWYTDGINALHRPEARAVAELVNWAGPSSPPIAPGAVTALGRPGPIRPSPIRGRREPAETAGWTPPPPLSPGRAEEGIAVPVGVAESGGTANLWIRQGEPLLIAGLPAADAAAEAVADRLGSDGWVVLWVQRALPDKMPEKMPDKTDDERLAGAERWHRIRRTRHATDTGEFWLRELADFAPLRQAVAQCLHATVPALAGLNDPASAACIDKVLASAGEEAGLLRDGSPADLRRYALDVVDQAAGLSYARPGDIRRTAALHAAVVDALRALRPMTHLAWQAEENGRDGSCLRVRVDLPAGAESEAALLATVIAGSLLRTAGVCARLPEQRPVPTDDFTIDAHPRGESTMTAEEIQEFIKHAQPKEAGPGGAGPEAAQTQSTGAAAEPTDRLPLDNPWVSAGVLQPGRARRLCVTLAELNGTEGAQLLRWFRPGGLAGEHALVTCISVPGDADLKAASAYGSVLVGPLPDDLLTQLQVGAGIQLRHALVRDLGQHGAVYVPAFTGGGRPQRMIIEPCQVRGESRADAGG